MAPKPALTIEIFSNFLYSSILSLPVRITRDSTPKEIRV